MKIIFEFLLGFVPGLFEPITKYVKLQFFTLYLEGVELARTALVNFLLAIFGILLAIFSIVFIHIALFLLIPWSIQTGAIVMLGLGVLYFIIGIILVIRTSSKRAWQKTWRVDKIRKALSIDDL